MSKVARGGDRRSMEQQSEENRGAIGANGWTPGPEYDGDANRSASRFATKQRDDFARLLADLDAGRLGVLVMWETSRGSRKLGEWAGMLDLCREHGVLIHVTSHGRTYDMRNARDWRTLAEDGVDNAYESEKTSGRLRRDVAASARAGRPHGHVPYGYVRQYDPKTGALVAQVPDTEPRESVTGEEFSPAGIVREIVTRTAGGDPVITITNDLNARGIPSPRNKAWSRYIVKRVATNPVYIGKRSHHGELSDATWSALDNDGDDTEWEATYWSAVRTLSDPKRKTTRPGRQVHLLTYFAECGKCEAPLSGRYVTASDAWSVNCSKTDCVSTREAWLNEPIERIVKARLKRPDAYEAFAASDDKAVVDAQREAAELRARLESFIDRAADGKITEDALGRIERRLKPKIADADRRARDAAIPRALRELVEPDADVDARWKAMSVPAKREVIGVILERIALDRSSTRGGRRGSLDWTRVRVLPRGSEEWVRLKNPEEME
ncbi:recombinase family protein [Actinomadura chokoriensis]|uniref:recombinase family protein n=1 Tax=Actinomadura chokoriensis TaxID=454156 RepID=UPI0031F74AE6